MAFENIQDVKNKLRDIYSDTSVCLNGTVVQLSFSFTTLKNRKKTVAYTQLSNCLIETYQRVNVSVVRLNAKVQSVLNLYNSLAKRPARHSSVLSLFLSESFEFPVELNGAGTVPVPETEVNVPPVSPVKREPVTISVSTPCKTRRDCANCPSTKKVNFSLKKTLKEEKSKCRSLKTFAASVKRKLNIKGERQKVSRKQQQIETHKRTIKELKLRIQRLEKNVKNGQCDLEVKRLRRRNNDLVKKLAREKKFSREQSEEIKKLNTYCEHLQTCLQEQKQDLDVMETTGGDSVIQAKAGKSYAPSIRRFIYECLACDVPVQNCGQLMSSAAQVLCNKKLSNTPSAATCAQMAYELGVLTTIQLMEYVLSSSTNVCLSWDATSIEGFHINEVHLTVNRDQCLVLDVRHLPGGKAVDYVSHIVSALSEAADMYSRYTGLLSSDIFHSLKSAITSTLTDRAAVNACVTRQLADELDAVIMQLNCNIHPLDSIARDAKKALAALDKRHNIVHKCYGTEGAAAGVINAVSVLRFKDGSGDPTGFRNMLRANNLPDGTFVRYVGNRIHILFHLAGVLLLHWTKVQDLLKLKCTAGANLKERLSKDMANEQIMVQVWALAICGKLVTGPWMKKFYSSDMSNLDMRPYVQTCVRQLQTWIKSPQCLLQPSKDVFGESLSSKDDVLNYLCSFQCVEVHIQMEALAEVLNACVQVLERQLHLFLKEDSLSPEEKRKVSSAPTHNMASERSLGCYDKMFRRAPIATGGFLSGKVRFKMNNCAVWLDSKPADERNRLTVFAEKEGRGERARKQIQNRNVHEVIAQRREEISNEKKAKEKNAAVKAVRRCFKMKSVTGIDCSESLKGRILNFLEEPESVTGILFMHTIEDVEYYGRIQNAGSPDTEFIEVSYWGTELSETSSVDHRLDSVSFFADAVLGKVVFL